jgi:hypothetical protein
MFWPKMAIVKGLKFSSYKVTAVFTVTYRADVAKWITLNHVSNVIGKVKHHAMKNYGRDMI